MGKLQETLADFNLALDNNPKNTLTLTNRGDLYRQMGRYDEAIIDLNESLIIRSDNTEVLNNNETIPSRFGTCEKCKRFNSG
ncbi:24606_t:CDS:1, partial [Cetraspora pellucida]